MNQSNHSTHSKSPKDSTISLSVTKKTLLIRELIVITLLIAIGTPISVYLGTQHGEDIVELLQLSEIKDIPKVETPQEVEEEDEDWDDEEEW